MSLSFFGIIPLEAGEKRPRVESLAAVPKIHTALPSVRYIHASTSRILITTGVKIG